MTGRVWMRVARSLEAVPPCPQVRCGCIPGSPPWALLATLRRLLAPLGPLGAAAHRSQLCPHPSTPRLPVLPDSPLPSPLSPNSLSLGFLLRYPLYFEALCSERSVYLPYILPSLGWSHLCLMFWTLGLWPELAVFKMTVTYPEDRRLNSILIKPMSFEPKHKPSPLIMSPFSTSLSIFYDPIILCLSL